ncbi:hypothetical protein FNU2_93 [Fusobacterium phage vB_FnuS_FNU2]|nr:hypothetical protein FNU2_93 [Fusobacterium phage vB_FnuS_FNU2]
MFPRGKHVGSNPTLHTK